MSAASTSARPTSIRDEILDLANTLEDSQTRLRQLVLRLESQDSETWQSRFEDMEKAHKEAVNGAKWLRVQNAELEQQLGQHKPAIENALSAREAAFHKLKHARKVIRDLLDERRDMWSPRTRGMLTQEEIDEVLDDEFNRDQDSNSSSSSGSDKTVRLAAHSPSHGINTPESSQRSLPVSPAHTVRSEATHAPLSFGSAGTSLTSFQFSPPRSSPRGSPDMLYIHFKKPPGSSTVCEGPISWEELESLLKLDEDMMNSLQSLSLSVELGMRLQLVRVGEHNIAFLYDPIFLDTRQRSHILDWGRDATNTNIERYISRHKGVDLVFHTFIFPLNKKSWFYIGALQWSVVQFTDCWKTLEGKSRAKIVNKLSERTLGEVDRKEMGDLLDKELKQICVELTRVGDAKASIDFAQTVLGRSPPYAESRHERRAEGVRE